MAQGGCRSAHNAALRRSFWNREIAPHRLFMAERCIDDAPGPMGPRPGQRPPIWTPTHIQGRVRSTRSWIEAQQHAGAATSKSQVHRFHL